MKKSEYYPADFIMIIEISGIWYVPAPSPRRTFLLFMKSPKPLTFVLHLIVLFLCVLLGKIKSINSADYSMSADDY